MSAREAHSLKIRGALIKAGEELLAEYPVDAISINRIVETAGVAKGSFYNHFLDKDALANAVSSAIRADIERDVAASNQNVTDPAYKIVRGGCQHIKLAVLDPRRATVMLRNHGLDTSVDYALNQSMEKDLAQGIESSRFAARCEGGGSIQVMGATVFTMLRVIEQKLSVEQTIDLSINVFTLILCGFGLSEDEAARIVGDSARDIIRD